jgi:hypothetical protein
MHGEGIAGRGANPSPAGEDADDYSGNQVGAKRALNGSSRPRKDRDLTWPDLLSPRLPAPPQTCPQCQTSVSFGWRRVALRCLELGTEGDVLTDWEACFLEELRHRRYPPSARQAEILNRIARSVGVQQ